MTLTKKIQEKLAAPFDDSEVRFKPTVVKDGRALALPYIDARTILDRLDDIVGPENWYDEYEVVNPHQVICKLTVYGITKSDAGIAGETEREPLKSAVSDALKRAAVKFGIGRYLYRLPKIWCRYDSAKGEFIDKPDLNSPVVEKKASTDVAIEKSKAKQSDDETASLECASCKEKITNRVAIFSKKYYQKPLCMKCQNAAMQEKELVHN